jgi:hypothetical protein
LTPPLEKISTRIWRDIQISQKKKKEKGHEPYELIIDILARAFFQKNKIK